MDVERPRALSVNRTMDINSEANLIFLGCIDRHEMDLWRGVQDQLPHMLRIDTLIMLSIERIKKKQGKA
jgi:hypothetical protein